MSNDVTEFTVTQSGRTFYFVVGPNSPASIRTAAARLLATARACHDVVEVPAAISADDIISDEQIARWLTSSGRLRSATQAARVPGKIVAALMSYPRPGTVPLACATFRHHYGLCRCPELGGDVDPKGQRYPEWRYSRQRTQRGRTTGWCIVKRELLQVDVSQIPTGHGGKMSPQTREHLLALIALVRG